LKETEHPGLAGFPSISRSALLESLGGDLANVVVLVPTDRLARSLRSPILSSAGKGGPSIVEVPRVYRFGEWLRTIWNLVGDERALLPPATEHVFWEQVLTADEHLIGNDDRELGTAEILGLASSLAQAWELASLWQLGNPTGAESDEVELFRRTARSLRQHLAAEQWITDAELPRAIKAIFDAGAGTSAAVTTSAHPTRVVLLGFELLEPAYRDLLDVLVATGTQIEVCDGSLDEAATVHSGEALTAQDEIRAAARDIAAALHENSDLRVGVVVCDLERDRLAVEQVFVEELYASAALPGEEDLSSPIDVAGGIPLADQAVIRHALDLLGLTRTDIAFELFSRILLAPYPRPAKDEVETAAVEREGRGQLEADLRGRHAGRVDLSSAAEGARRFGAKIFGSRLEAFGKRLDDSRTADERPQSLAYWLQLFEGDLHAFGWPGAAGDPEGTTIKRWQKLVGELSALSAQLPGMSRRDALSRVFTSASSQSTQTPTPGAPVQVVGLLDAAGLVFDRLWVIGMNDHVVPASASPSSFLPARWQRDRAVRRGSADVELEFARRRWSRLQNAAPELHVSWRRQGPAGEELGPSSLLDLGAEVVKLPPSVPWYGASRVPEFLGCELESILEARPEEGPLPPPVKRTVSVSSWRDVAACSFRGVARGRWGLKPLESVAVEPCAMTRGTIFHAAMEALHLKFGSAESLAHAEDTEIRSCAYNAALAKVRGGGLHAVDEALHDSVANWAADEALDWVIYEKHARSEPWETEGTEKNVEFDVVPGLTVKGSIDRVDRLEDNTLVVIDYKTSAKGKGDGEWKSARPADPQLLFYVEALRRENEQVSALAFANVTGNDERALKGLADRDLAKAVKTPDKSKDWPPDWSAALATMSSTVTSLAQTYLDGDHSVDPYRGLKSCGFCGLEALCRVYEASDLEEEDSADESTGSYGRGQE
jgi:ATP-dependent helicase/nuclease subunit B